MSDAGGQELLPEACFDEFLGHDWMPVAIELRPSGAVTTSVCSRCGTPGVQPEAATDVRRLPLPEARFTRPEAAALGLEEG